MNVTIKKSAMTREGAILLRHPRSSDKDVEADAKSVGFDVAHATVYRHRHLSWRNPKRKNEGILAFVGFDVAQQIAHDLGQPYNDKDESAVASWIALNEWDVLLATVAPESSLWDQNEVEVREIIKGLEPDSFLRSVVLGSAKLHLARNKRVAKTSESQELLQAAIGHLEDALEPHFHDYAEADLKVLFDPLNLPRKGKSKNDEKPPILSSLHADMTGIMVSNGLHLLSQARFSQSPACWAEFLGELDDAGLVAQLAVRGVVLHDPIPLLNQAEAYWVLEQEAQWETVIGYAVELEPELMVLPGIAEHLNPDFVRAVKRFLKRRRPPE